MEGDYPKYRRIDLLAIPSKRRKSKKFIPARYIPGCIDSGVRPGAIKGKPKENWRITELSKMVDYKASEKLNYVVQSEAKLKKQKDKELEIQIINKDNIEKQKQSYVQLPYLY